MYVHAGDASGTKVRAFAADGCGAPSYPAVATVDTGPGQSVIHAVATEEALFAGDRRWAHRLCAGVLT